MTDSFLVVVFTCLLQSFHSSVHFLHSVNVSFFRVFFKNIPSESENRPQRDVEGCKITSVSNNSINLILWSLLTVVCFLVFFFGLFFLFIWQMQFWCLTHFSDARIIFDIIGSTGNSAIRRPSFVSSPLWLSAPSAYSCSRARTRVSWGGGSIKSKWMRSLMPRLFSNKTTFPRLVLWIWKKSTTLYFTSWIYVI